MAKKSDKLDDRIQEICNRIKELRISAGYSSAETFAFDKGENRVQYWRVENGANITLNTLIRILDHHNITLQDFFNSLS